MNTAAILFMLTSPLWSASASADLPEGNAPAPVGFPHFPDRVSAFVWRNWSLVPIERMAKVIAAKPADIVEMGKQMGLPDPQTIPDSQWRRSYITIIRRNWHLLGYEQLLQLLDWTPEQLAFTLREDDFLYIKLGNHKPKCEPLVYKAPDEQTRERLRQIGKVITEEFTGGLRPPSAPLFDFVNELSAPVEQSASRIADHEPMQSRFSPRFCYSYFAVYGDPLLDPSDDPYPDGYLARLAAAGVDGVWLQAVLYKLAPFPWDARLSDGYEKRLENLRQLVAKARKHGIGMYLYLNEPRAMPLEFFKSHPDFKGITEGDHAALCTSVPAIQHYLTDSVASICQAVPDLAGFFTITAAENLTNCWTHANQYYAKGEECPRCKPRGQAAVVAEVNTLFQKGIERSGGKQKLLVWDWVWNDDQMEKAIRQLPAGVSLMSVSEWSLPIERGGIRTIVDEYSISSIGPGPRARRNWEVARQQGLPCIAKIQAGNTWELSAVPYIPAVANVAQHVANLRDAGVSGLMLGWTLGGYPSPNLQVVAEMGRQSDRRGHPTVDEAMMAVARRRFGADTAPTVVAAWKQFSDAFSQFPYHQRTLYNAPLQTGPANPLWSEPTGYRSTMVGFPYDSLGIWQAVYSTDVFVSQLEKVARGFEEGIVPLEKAREQLPIGSPEAIGLGREIDVARACAIHFQSTANQSRFVRARDALAKATTADAARPLLAEIQRVLKSEIDLARRLYAIQQRDSRIGFEASNQYNYVPLDLVEKVVNCRDLLDRWLPSRQEQWASH